MDFDDLLTSAARLRILAALVPGEPLTFMELKRATGLADGNLHVQTQKLAEASYLEVRKETRGKRGLTRFRISERGLASLKLHVRKLQAILETEAGKIGPVSPSDRRGDESQVWSNKT